MSEALEDDLSEWIDAPPLSVLPEPEISEESETAGVEAMGQDKEDKLPPGELAQAREDEEPTLEDALLALPSHWMRVYVRELYRTADPGMARRCVEATVGTLLPRTLERKLREVPEFGLLVSEHAKVAHENVFSAIYRGATQGHAMPLVSQGKIVGSYDKPDTRAQELWLKAHGLMADQKSSLTITHQGKVEMSHDEQLGGILDMVTQGLFLGAGPVIEAEIVKDGGEGVSK